MNKIFIKIKLVYLIWLFFLLLNIAYSFSAYPKAPTTEWLSLKYDKTYLRTGPSKQNKVLWTYKKKGLPLKLIRKKGDWYEVEMPEQIKGWVNSSQISFKRRVLIISENPINIRKKEEISSKIIAKASRNVVGELIRCQKRFCKINFYKIEGFVEKDFLWGVN